MSSFKPLLTSDVTLSPFEVNKTFIFNGDSELNGVNINRYIGTNIPTELYAPGYNSTGQTIFQDEYLVYNSIKHLYYTNFLDNPNGSNATTSSLNIDDTRSGGAQTTNYINYLPNTLPSERYFPTDDNVVIGVISIPSNLYGEFIKPKTLEITTPSITLTDDGEGNIISNNLKVGDIIYQHGIIILTSDGIPMEDGYSYSTYGAGTYSSGDFLYISNIINDPDLSIEFQSTLTLHESQYKITIRENEFNFSQNPTLISGSSNNGTLNEFATSSYFSPYITSVGLYNNNKELLAIAKLSQPLPISPTTDTTIMINLDL